jgi:glycosyltransferase involved in cell wall biosynthesis
MIPVVHAITPGDHYSPRTGSRIPSVVHGLASAAHRDPAGPRYRHTVLVGAETWRPRYESARSIEYPDVAAPTRNERFRDVGAGLLGRSRSATERYWQPVANAMANLEPSIVVAHNAPILPSLLRGTDHRVILYAHNDVLRTMTKREAAHCLDSVASIVCVSASLATQIAAHLPPHLAERIAVVGNGVDCAQFVPGRRPHAGPLRVIMVGRMIEQKGPDILLKAAAQLDRRNVEVLLVGSHGFDPKAPLTRYERRLRDLASRCPVPVEFDAFVPRAELAELLQSADIMVVPSRWQEPSGLTVGEALASGLPVIAHRVGGIPEVLGSAGILVDSERPDRLARAIEALVDDPDRRSAMAITARRHAETHDWAWAWENLKSVLAGGSRGTREAM